MNKFLKIAGITTLVAALVLVGAAVAFAQTPTPPEGAGPWNGGGFGGQNPLKPFGHGMRGGGFLSVEGMHAQIAEALGLSEAEFEAALAEGKTPGYPPAYTLAEELGVDFAEVQAAMQEARAEALAQAVEEGKVTQEQADWILSRHAEMGAGAGMFGPRGRGGPFGGHAGECPYEAAP